jgi:hypothetical protein
MKKLLVKFDSNWADEMDIDGFMVMTQDEWDQYKAHTKKFFEQLGERSWSFGIGTNEEIEYESHDEFIRELKVEEITDVEYESLAHLFKYYDGTVQFGFFPDLGYFDLEDLEDLE